MPSVQQSQSSREDPLQDLDAALHWCVADLWTSRLYPPVPTHAAVSAEQCIVMRYRAVDRVQAIYIQSLPGVINVWVLLRQDHYDDGLMDSLLDLEGEILDLYPDQLFEFHYIPLIEARQNLPIPASAVLVFDRQR